MSGSEEPEKGPSPDIVRRTFRAELIRSLAAGVTETALATFAILIAVRQYESGPAAKAIILGSHAVGLLVSLFVVPLAVRLGWAVNRMAAGISFFSAAGFFTAAIAGGSEVGFIAGISLGFFGVSLPLPLQTQYLRLNYPNDQRGQLFSRTLLARGLATMVFAAAGGWFLDLRFDLFRWLLVMFGAATLVSSICYWVVPSAPAGNQVRLRPSLFQAMRWIGKDPPFRLVLCSAMAMGIGVHTANALRVDYLANPEHGLEYGATLVAILSGILPAAVRVISTLWWGRWFDRVNFYWLRAAVNVLFIMAIALYFSTGFLWLIVVGAALLGLARGGGEIMWNLWVTKLAAPENVGEYMSVHTFFTGIRALAAPFLGFYLVDLGSVKVMMAFSLFFVAVSIVFLIPMMRKGEAGS